LRKAVTDFISVQSGGGSSCRNVVAGALAVVVLVAGYHQATASEYCDGHCDDPAQHVHHMDGLHGDHGEYIDHCNYQAGQHCDC